jgi:glucose/arabinose dehydrogenase
MGLMLVLASCGPAGQEPVATTMPESVPTTTIPSTTTAPIDAEPSTSSSTSVASSTSSTLPPLAGLNYELVTDALEFPIAMKSLPGSDTAWIATKDGRIWTMTDGTVDDTPVADLSAQIRNNGEQGFLGLEIHPDRSDALWVHYSDRSGSTVVSEVVLGADGAVDERVLFTQSQPAANHNGGEISLGPDGRLYLALGDGGGANDRFGHGQNTDSLLGGIVRIDPDTGDSSLWSWGLRNPWRFAFDGDQLYIGDVGQNAYEEINVVEFRPEGYNFGWPITEALHCFSPASGCDPEGLTLPVIEVEHGDAGTCSITGGVVYRGSEIPELYGHYVYSDFCGGWLRSFLVSDGVATEMMDWTEQVGQAGSVVSFGLDGAGEVYVLTTGRIVKLTANR